MTNEKLPAFQDFLDITALARDQSLRAEAQIAGDTNLPVFAILIARSAIEKVWGETGSAPTQEELADSDDPLITAHRDLGGVVSRLQDALGVHNSPASFESEVLKTQIRTMLIQQRKLEQMSAAGSTSAVDEALNNLNSELAKKIAHLNAL